MNGMNGLSVHDITGEKWDAIGQAPMIFWVVVGVVVIGLVGFIVWAARSKKVPHSIAPGVLGGLVGLFIVWTFFLYLVPAMTATAVPVTDRTWSWEYGEIMNDPGGSGLTGEPRRGLDVYVSQACSTCHTMYVRPQDLGTGWAEGVSSDDVARAEDYVRMPSPPMGTQRNGPDLSWIGRRIADMGYQIDHLIEPRKYKPDSIMPTYRHLSEKDLNDLAAFLVTLGNSKQSLLSGTVVSQPATDDLSPSARLGADLYRSLGCVACHTLDGGPSVGPTWYGIWGEEEEMEDGSVVVVDRDYLHESIVDPNAKIVKGFAAVMPPYSQLTDEEIDALIDFIESVGGDD